MSVMSRDANGLSVVLESMSEQAKSPVRSLVIAHNDARLIHALSSAMADESVAMLEVSQDTWEFDNADFVQPIEWALQREEVETLVVAGSSRVAGPGFRVSLPTPKPKGGYDKLLAGVRSRSARNRQAQDVFAGQVRQLLQLPIVNEQISCGRLSLYCLLYQFDSGFFLAYDADEDIYRAIGQ